MSAPREIDPALFDDGWPPLAEPLPAPPAAPSPRPSIDVTVLRAPLPLAEVLPADFPLPVLTRFVPDPQLRAALEGSAVYAAALEVDGVAGLQFADSALATMRAQSKAIEQHFAEPVDVANRLHKRLTGLRAEWLALGEAAIATLGRRVAREKLRLDAIEADRRRQAQAEADRETRAALAREAAAVAAQGAPAHVVAQLEGQAKTATAPPVPPQSTAAPALATTTVTKTWKARIKGTPADAPANPSTAELTPPQIAPVLALLAAIVADDAALALIELNWSLLNARAKAEKGTLAIPGIEAYEEAGTRARPGRRL